MRSSLFAAVALAPLLLSLAATGARADSTVSSSTSTPQTTSSVNDNLIIGSGATINPTSGSAVTVDSNNDFTNNGSITMSSSADGSTGLLINGGLTGTISNSGAISVTDNYTASDSKNGDGIAEAPFATGTSRYGIHMLGDHFGWIYNTGSIAVEGNNSLGISLEGTLNGSLLSTGTISVLGDNSTAAHIAAVTQNVEFSNTISATGQGTVGVRVAGDIGGRLSFYSTVTSSGYATNTRPTTSSALNKIEATPTDVEQGGSAVLVQGSVAGGIFVGAPPAGTTSTSTGDLDGDGVADNVEGTGVITTYGSAPALAIGGSTPITIGMMSTGDNAYGLIVRGQVVSNGVWDGVSSTAIDIGQGGGGVTVAGGLRMTGTVSSTAYQSDATAIHLESGAALDAIRNEGTVSAYSTTAGANSVTAVQLDAGARLTQMINYNTLTATAAGDNASVWAVKDNSGSISFVENTGTIKAAIKPTTATDTVTGKAVALDLSKNTSGMLLRQELIPGSTVSPVIVGDILLGSGTNTVQLYSGSVTGALDLGSGSGGSLTIEGGAIYLGALTYEGSGLAVAVNNGSLTTTSASTINGSTLKVGSNGTLVVSLDPAKDAATYFNLTGAASFASGAKLGVRLLSTTAADQTFTIVKASSLSVADLSSLITSTPYLFSVTASADYANNTLNVTAHERTAAEMGMNKSEAAALPAVYAALSHDSGVQSALLSATDKGSFTKLYDQMLPDHSGDVLAVATAVTDAAARGALERPRTHGGYWESGSAAWLQEISIGMTHKKGDGEAWRAQGFGLVGGIEFGNGGQTLGVSFGGSTSNVDQTVRPGASNLSISTLDGSIYWRAEIGDFLADARLGAGFMNMKDRRILSATVDDAEVLRQAQATWNGYNLNARAGLAYEGAIGAMSLTPRVHLDAIRLKENGYAETGGGDGFNMIVQGRVSQSSTATASLTAGWEFGGDFKWRPQVEAGVRTPMGTEAGSTTARFAYGGDAFTLSANSLKENTAIARVALTGTGDFVNFAVEATGEVGRDYNGGALRANFRVPF